MSDGAHRKPPEPGAPAWVMTFADLMSLLMCFFVLLLAFSEMDVLKFKQLAGSMKMAFGVQREIKAKEIPKGISVIAREFSPGKPDPTVLNEVRQHTTDTLRRHLEVEDDPGKQGEGEDGAQIVEVEVPRPEVDAAEFRRAFAEEIREGLVEIDVDDQRVIIRIQEKGAFPSGAASMMPRFEPVIERIGGVLSRTSGRIVVAGHTDDIPIATVRFRSNWELSAARSVTVVHHLSRVTGLSDARFLIEGHADTQPLVPNVNRENRARNRRVEIVIVNGEDIDAGEIDVVPGTEGG